MMSPGRGAGQAHVLALRQAAFKSARTRFEHLVDHFALARIERDMLVLSPEPRAHKGLFDHSGARLTRISEHVRERLVVRRLATTQFGRNAVQPRSQPRVLSERHVDDGPADPAVAVLERMNTFEPDVREVCTQDAVERRGAGSVEPIEECATEERTFARSKISPSMAAVATASPNHTSRCTRASSWAPITAVMPQRRPLFARARLSGPASCTRSQVKRGQAGDVQFQAVAVIIALPNEIKARIFRKSGDWQG